MENEFEELFSYQPDPEARKRRLLAQARELVNEGKQPPQNRTPVEYDENLHKCYLAVTFRCPLKCPFCFAEGGERDCNELSAEGYLEIVRQVVELGYDALVITGGEPLAYREFDALVEGLDQIERKKTKFVLRSSMGFPIADERIARICELFDEVVVSIDGDEQRHDSLRGTGTYQLAVENVRRCLAREKAIVSVNAVMSQMDFQGEQGESIKNLCDMYGIEKLTIQSALPIGRGAKCELEYPFKWKKHEQKKQYEVVKRQSCGIGHNIYVEPDGKAYPCHAWCGKRHMVGDLTMESLDSILQKDSMLTLKNSGVDTNEKCRNCDVRYFCGGLCKAYSKDKNNIDSGDFDCEIRRRQIMGKLKHFGVIE